MNSRKRPKVIDIEKGISSLQEGLLEDNYSIVGYALYKVNEWRVMEQIDNWTYSKRELENEWKKEKKQASFDTDEDRELYKSSMQQKVDQLIAA